ncbi:hypothetical protein SZ54_4894 [Rhizobium sp. UR51a]|nr:hypothetical protein SZ54_4894 [Rhizobium sp. UR51a]
MTEHLRRKRKNAIADDQNFNFTDLNGIARWNQFFCSNFRA